MSALLTQLLPGGGPVRQDSAPGQADPWDSGMWPLHRADWLGDPADWRNDAAVVVLGPEAAEDAMHVPFTLDATGVGAVERIVVTIDYSPIPQVLTFWPGRARPLLGFGVKYESGSPLRASVQRAGGGWRMGAHYVSATGGGCTAPAAAHGQPDWQEGFGEMRARLWPDTGRLRVWLRHPQDTGLAPGIAAHHLTEMVLEDDAGQIARLELHAPVEENPALTFLLPEEVSGPVTIRARDTMGYRFAGEVAA
ncbi:quinoprotein dehydrogenase-associated SoxYZ-like carrier [Ponticoccus gilvus]|nr:quinoprotein dehydrogenase-associated SoxYZ-like carrier [Enemella evansiae]